MVAGAKMSADDQLVLETVSPFDEIIQVHVAELVNLLPAVIGPDKAQLGNQHLGLEDRRIVVQASGAGIAGISHQRRPYLTRHRHPRKAQVTDLVAGQPVILLLKLVAEV